MSTNDPIARRFVTLDGRRVSYLWRDGGHDGPTLLFIHGSGMSARYWSDQLRALADTARVLAVDLPGHGESDDAPTPSLARYADVTAGVIDAVGAAADPGRRCRDLARDGRHRGGRRAARARADPLRQPRSRHAAGAVAAPARDHRRLPPRPRRRRRPHAPDRGIRRRESRDRGLCRLDHAAACRAGTRRRRGAPGIALAAGAPPPRRPRASSMTPARCAGARPSRRPLATP